MDNFDDKYKKKNPFTVPDGYFDGLTDQIMQRVEKQKEPRRPRFLQVLRPYMGVAAIFILALMIVQAVMPLVVDKGQLFPRDTVEQVMMTPEEIEEDIFDSHFNPTSDEIIEYLASEVDNYELMYAGVY